ncbi:hypothetical protein K2173_008687 [Erythroxylum novogranatense]|uniref:protein-serine/threonine phosphatase n=1 Tax=Erythroxylum novogranatense TaxID=1862640 RepID=A0AAV8SL47_9ROSI|nr:hypothetical protein K2173_008687 [Erythroxylum novogranatense]
MANTNRRMQNNRFVGEEDTPERCRERRQRRIMMRRQLGNNTTDNGSAPQTSQTQVTPTASGSSCGASSSGKRVLVDESGSSLSKRVSTSGDKNREDIPAPSSSPPPPPQQSVVTMPAGAVLAPVFGSMSVAGRSREMEDAILTLGNLCEPEINDRRPVHVFGVFDGHGGSHVARMCRQKMHVVLGEELARADGAVRERSRESDQNGQQPVGWVQGLGLGGEEWKLTWTQVLKRIFHRVDQVALSMCPCGAMGNGCRCHPMEMAFEGSTAVLSILTPEHIIVANCGDSRAVLCRRGRPIALSFDHKPDRPDELARITAAGGRVTYQDLARVEGILAMSRAIGDKFLKPVVISEPEITFRRRDPEDECLIIASDGLWDVMSMEVACEVAVGCLREASPISAGSVYDPSRSILAAALLTRLALGRESLDNISVIVVDLKRS